MRCVRLAEPFASLWQNRDPFAEVERLPGRVYRALQGRRTLRTEVGGRGYFVKIHHGVGWRDIVKNWLTGKVPVLGAGNEWRALQRLHEAGVPTMRAVAFGERGANPARRHSFIITEELAPTVDLEQIGKQWAALPPARKHALIAEVARVTAAMHAAGVNHRDCYLCHFLLHQAPSPPTPLPLAGEGSKPAPPAVPSPTCGRGCPEGAGEGRLSLIDLHRAQVRRTVPRRWRNKDLAALYFSALDLPLTRNQRLRFLRGYFQAAFLHTDLRHTLRTEAPRLAWLQRRAQKLHARFVRKYAPPAGSAA